MDLVQVIVLALIQGITEFLPISSSAHLILPSALLGWEDQGLAFDVAVHIGTLLAVMIYFRKDVMALVIGWFQQFGERGANKDSQLAWAIVLATIPAGVVGLLGKGFIEEHLRSVSVIAATTIIFGILLAWADKTAKLKLQITQMTLMFALIIGCAQALALIPGTSRSGITITMALILGFTRSDSARFSFLMSIPVILLSGMFEGMELLGQSNVDWFSVFLGASISALSAYLCIHYFLAFITRLGMMPFVIYRLILGFSLIAVIVFQ